MAKPSPIIYEHLLGIPWERMNCQSVVRAVYESAGITLPPNALGYPVSDCWERVGDTYRHATEALDVIASDPESRGVESHLSVLVRSGHPWTVVTSSDMAGVHAMRRYAVRNVLGVYRLKVPA